MSRRVDAMRDACETWRETFSTTHGRSATRADVERDANARLMFRAYKNARDERRRRDDDGARDAARATPRKRTTRTYGEMREMLREGGESDRESDGEAIEATPIKTRGDGDGDWTTRASDARRSPRLL